MDSVDLGFGFDAGDADGEVSVADGDREDAVDGEFPAAGSAKDVEAGQDGHAFDGDIEEAGAGAAEVGFGEAQRHFVLAVGHSEGVGRVG